MNPIAITSIIIVALLIPIYAFLIHNAYRNKTSDINTNSDCRKIILIVIYMYINFALVGLFWILNELLMVSDFPTRILLGTFTFIIEFILLFVYFAVVFYATEISIITPAKLDIILIPIIAKFALISLILGNILLEYSNLRWIGFYYIFFASVTFCAQLFSMMRD